MYAIHFECNDCTRTFELGFGATVRRDIAHERLATAARFDGWKLDATLDNALCPDCSKASSRSTLLQMPPQEAQRKTVP